MVEIKEVIDCDEKYFMNVFSGRYPLVVENGKGVKLYGKDGKEYYDFLSGIGVNILGYNHQSLKEALIDQIQKVLHVSNLYYIEPQARLEKILINNSFADRVFFTNSGAEANEGALKLARKYHKNRNRYEIISFINSFHGRTLGTLAATGQEKYRTPFQPMPAGFKYTDFNNIDTFIKTVTQETAAVIIEPVQGEGGVYPAQPQFLREVSRICKKKDILLIFDEIQTGMGRTGQLFAYEKYGIEPDIITLAKGLGGGVPIGAFLATEKVASAFTPGDHGSTFGGNHLATKAAYTVFKILEEENILSHVRKTGTYFKKQLSHLKEKIPGIKGVRGLGLMLGLELEETIPANEIVNLMFNRGFLLNAVQEHTLRFLPPLIITEGEIDLLLKELEEILNLKGDTGNEG